MPTKTELANAIRVLAMDAVQKANSGHPGMPMGMADIAEVLFRDYMNHSPKQPQWANRDRFVLSNGHGSMLLYAVLYLTGYDMSIEDLKAFRQLHSKTPGHPEYGLAAGVETTTGPLGQGFANAVGMAIAESRLGAEFNREGFNLINHYTYAFMGDGCMMEGISHEAASLAGTLGLGKLIAFWDDNGISIDGGVKEWFSEHTAKRFEAYGWHVVESVNGHDAAAITKAIEAARAEKEKPSLICCKTKIAYGSPNLAGSEKSHGAPLGNDEIQATRKQLGWDSPPFIISEDIKEAWNAVESGRSKYQAWESSFKAYSAQYPELARELTRRLEKRLPDHLEAVVDNYLQELINEPKDMATRKSSLACLDKLGSKLPELMGGSADLTGSNLTMHVSSRPYSSKDRSGNYLYYGVREFGMSAIMNGMALYGGLIPYGGTFLVFSDYARNAIRLSALMKQRVIYVLTHDSIGLGEDGPTHQPIEHLSMLRMTPQLTVWRPADSVETLVAWNESLKSKEGPSVLALSRQTLPALSRTDGAAHNIKKGGYILKDCQGQPELILIATGSEVGLAALASEKLSDEGIKVRVVSMPSTDRFLAQSEAYREEVLPRAVKKRVAIEAASSDYWYRFVGLDGHVIGIDRFGDSAPAPELFEAFGFSVENIYQTVKNYFEEGVIYAD